MLCRQLFAFRTLSQPQSAPSAAVPLSHRRLLSAVTHFVIKRVTVTSLLRVDSVNQNCENEEMVAKCQWDIRVNRPAEPSGTGSVAEFGLHEIRDLRFSWMLRNVGW